jgi:succinate-semialdehyde dehydrogenase/glutarate-semialdehyde dehydrogenase
MAGNTVLLKPSSATPLVGTKIAELFEAAGCRRMSLSISPGDAATGQALIESKVDKVVFTGSVGIGRHVMATCAKNLTPCTLELGGKDPMIVRSDAQLEHASSGAVWGAFTNSGQCCASIERVYVHESIADAFIQKVVDKTNRLRQGNGMAPTTDIGPMTTQSQLKLSRNRSKTRKDAAQRY